MKTFSYYSKGIPSQISTRCKLVGGQISPKICQRSLWTIIGVGEFTYSKMLQTYLLSWPNVIYIFAMIVYF